MRLAHKHCLITGAAGDIGRATAHLMLDEGARVTLVDRDKDALQRTEAELPSDRVSSITADVTSEADAVRYATTAAERFGPVDALFVNAGIEGPSAPLEEFDLAAFESVMAVNVTGVFLGLKHVLPLMAHGGSIIITSSTAGLRGSANLSAYIASKHAVVGLMRAAAVETASRRIRVNAIHPSAVRGDMMGRIVSSFAGNGEIAAVQDRLVANIPLGRFVEPSEVAAAVVFLSSDESRMMTGTNMVLDGGSNAR